MGKDVKCDYDSDLDIIHIYFSEIDSDIKGCLSYGNFNLDIEEDGRVLGIELEGASSLLKMPSEILSNLDSADLIIRKSGNTLFIGFTVIKGEQKSTIQMNIPNIPTQRNKLTITN